MHIPRPAFLCGLLAAAPLLAPPSAFGDGWPGLWGPSGDGRAAAEARIPPGKPLRTRELWRRPIGSGFSAIAVGANRGVTALSDGTHDYVAAFDAGSGRELWRTKLGDTYRGHDGSKDGPISTPALDESRAFIVSPQGLLLALEAASGKVLWQRDLKAELGTPAPYYGFGTSPLVSGPHVIVQAGGEKSGLVALDRVTGQIAWNVTHSKSSNYASPVRATLGGVPQVVVLANDIVYGASPEDGRLLWSQPTGWTDEAMRPPLALPGDRVLISAMNEAKLVQLRKEGDRFSAQEAWRTTRLKNSLSPTVFLDGYLYGFSSGFLVCLDAATADEAWRQRVYAGSLVLVDGQLVILGADSGELRVARASPKGYEERLKAPVFNAGATSVTGPSVSGGRIFVRNLEELVALEIVG